jgi:hypothetical protein
LGDEVAAEKEEGVDGEIAEREGVEDEGEGLAGAVAVGHFGGVADNDEAGEEEAEHADVVAVRWHAA